MTFVWSEFLQETGSEIAAPQLFQHVETSIQPTLQPGQQLEVNTGGHWWRATVILMCGPLVSLRYIGFLKPDFSGHDFWVDVTKRGGLLKPLGWCKEHNISMLPPECLPKTVKLGELTSDICTAPSEIILSFSSGIKRCKQYDLIREGCYLECQHELDPLTVWPVKIVKNVGGRLHLSWFGSGNKLPAPEFILFYTHYRLHYLGWAQTKNVKYQAPSNVPMNRDISNMSAFLRGTPSALPVSYFVDPVFPIHSFEIGWKIEAVDPCKRHQLRPATIKQIINEMFFIVEMDDIRDQEERESIQFLCHAGCPLIMPANASSVRGIKLTPPPGWKDHNNFSWALYLEAFPGSYAPYESHFRCNRYEDLDNGTNDDVEFMLGVKLEAVNPNCSLEVCPATVTRIYGRLMWIHVDSEDRLSPDIMVDTKSCDLFPVGWCEMTGYPLKYPSAYNHLISDEDKEDCSDQQGNITDAIDLEDECPKLYFNFRCYTGAYLSKSGVESLPRFVGPGRVANVMSEVLIRLVNVSYKPFRVLRDFEAEENNQHDLMHLASLEVKCQKRLLATPVELPRYTRCVEEFCRQIGLLLEACPHLVSADSFSENECPEGCSARIKSKFIEKLPNWKRRYVVSKPLTLLSLSYKTLKAASSRDINEEDGVNADNFSDSSSTSAESKCPEPPTKMQTRGVRLPSYGLLDRRKRRQPVTNGSLDDSTQPIKVGKLATTHQKPTLFSHLPSKVIKHNFFTKDNKISPQSNVQQSDTFVSPSHYHQYNCDPLLLAGEIPSIKLESNPLFWTPNQLASYLKGTDCEWIQDHLRDEGVDGQAFLLLTLPIVRRLMGLQIDVAVKLCRHVVRLKRAFLEQFAVNMST